MAVSSKGVVITVPVLVLSISVAAVFLFFLLSSLSSSSSTSCSCPPPSPLDARGAALLPPAVAPVSTTPADVDWVKLQIQRNGLRMQDNVLRKGINPRTRQQQLQDLIQYSLSPFLFSSLCYYQALVLGPVYLDNNRG